MRGGLAIACCIALIPQPANATRVEPTRFGPWELRCFSNLVGEEEPRCNIDRRIWRLDESGNETNMGVTISSNFGESVTLTTFGLDAASCQQVTLQEQLPRGYDPLNTAPTDSTISSLHRHIVAVIRSHLQILAVCTPMNRKVAPFPIDRFDESVADLRRAIVALEAIWTRRRQQVNPVARLHETGR